MKTKTLSKSTSLFFVAALLSATNSFGQYTQNATNVLAPGPNVIEKSATAMTLAAFQSAVALAWTNGSGGVLNFPTTIANPTTIFRGNYGTNASRMQITSSVNMQNITTSGTSFTVVSTPNGTTSAANQSDYTLTLGLFNTNSGLPVVDQAIKQIGFVILSRGSAAGAYPLDLRVTVTFSDNSTQVVTSVIGIGSSADDTFFGFTAPSGLSILSVRFQSFVPNTTTPISDRIGWDDFGFITGPSVATPPPQIVNASPGAFAIAAATNGIHFEALTYVSVDPTNISLVLNEVDISSQLVFIGDSTNYSVSYNGLLPEQEYNMIINVTNSAGTATLSRTFYTTTNSFVLYDSEGFTNDTLYPLGPLQTVVHGRATWLPNTNEPPTIENDATQGKVLERMGTGASRPDYVSFPPVSSGVVTMEFDAFVSTTSGRTIDICIQPLAGGTTMGSFLAWGEVPGKLAYFDNVNWIAIADLPTEWHHVKIINYLSGAAAGKYDLLLNGIAIAQKLPWRNAAVGSAFNQFRIQTQNTALLFQSGRIDNLVITASPEDPNAVLPPKIVNVTPINRAFVRPSDGIHFDVTSDIPIAASNVVLRLNGTPVNLVITGTSNALSASYSSLTAGTYSLQIQTTNASGVSTVDQTFVATDEAWLVHPGDGWVGPWEWSSGTPELLSGSPIDGEYLHLDTTGGARNLMRQYQSGIVDVTKAHYIRWKFRLTEADFDANFNVFNDRVHFFAHPVSRIGASTTTGNSWAILAAGAESAGAIGGKTFWIYDNVEGNGAFNAANNVDSHVALRPDHIYSFEVLVMPETKSYSVVIADQTAGTSFTSAAPHKFRDLTETTHNFLHFGVQASSGTFPRAFDLDSVFVTQAPLPVTLLNPSRSATQFSFSFTTQAGTSYAVEFRDSLTTGDWQPLTTISGDGSTKTATDLTPPAGTRFYRVMTQ